MRERSDRRRTSPRVLAAVLCFVAAAGVAAVAVGRIDPPEPTRRAAPSKPGTTTTTEVVVEVVPTTTLPETGPSGWPFALETRPERFGPYGADPVPPAADAEPGLYLWSDLDGWHLWLVGPPGTRFTGRIDADHDLQRPEPEAVGGAMLTPRPAGLDLVLEAGAEGAAGLRFNPGFYSRRITIAGDPPETSLHLGLYEQPAALPLTLDR